MRKPRVDQTARRLVERSAVRTSVRPAGEAGSGQGATAGGRLQRHLAADLPDHQRDDGQPKTGARQAARRWRAPEPFEDVRKLVGGDARAVVAYGQLALPVAIVAVRAQPDIDDAAGRAELDRVVEQVHYGPFQRS